MIITILLTRHQSLWFIDNLPKICNRKKDTAIVSYLLQDGQCDPNSVTRDGRTPLDMTNDSKLIRLLLNHGAKPNSCFPTRLRDNPADAAIKMFVLGNPGVGKSTLVKAMSTKDSGFSRIKQRFTKVTDVEEKTAGIIPYDIHSEVLGRVTMFDFAGHREFYAGHDALLHNSMRGSPSIITLVVDMSEEEGKIRETVQYWLQFISNHSSEEGPNPHLVIIGSHAEKLPAKEKKLKSEFIMSLVNGQGLDNIAFAGHVILDCRYAESSSMSCLLSLLSQSCKSLRSSEEMAIAHHSFLVFLLDKFRAKVAVTFGEAQAALKSNLHSNKHVYLECVKSADPLEMCEKLNERGNILFMKNQECLDNGWIVLDKAVLLSQVNGVIFAPEGFKEHHNLSTDTGVVPVSKLAAVFSNLNSDMITRFLCHLEFCHEVTDPEILCLLQANSATPERYLFFPGLVDLDTPPDVWQPNDQFGYHSGWLLKCSRSEQFFSTLFLQVLLLRLAYSLAFAPSSLDCQILPRSCRVWKCGISWSIRSGVEIIVEVIDQKQVMAVMRCFKSQMKAIVDSIKTRSVIIENVLAVKKSLCPTVQVQEQLLHPECVVQYPPSGTKRNPVSIREIAQTVIESNACVLDESRTLLELDTLLFFEPYADLGEQILQEFFDTVTSQEITNEFVYRIAEKYDIAKCLLKKMDNLIAILELPPSKIHVANPQHPPGDIHKLAQVFKLWRDRMGKEGTRVNLRKKLDQFSIFAGRNPMEVTGWC